MGFEDFDRLARETAKLNIEQGIQRKLEDQQREDERRRRDEDDRRRRG